MMRPDAKVEKVYLYPKPVDFRKSIDGLAALVELDIKAAVFDPVLFVFLNKPRNRVKILYWECNGFCLWLKRLESERFKTSPDCSDGCNDPYPAITLQYNNAGTGFQAWRLFEWWRLLVEKLACNRVPAFSRCRMFCPR
jgi:hypothetical protein